MAGEDADAGGAAVPALRPVTARTDGRLDLYASGNAHLLADVTGYLLP